MSTLELCAEALVGFRHWDTGGDNGVYPGGSGLYPATDYGGCKPWADDGRRSSSVDSLDGTHDHAGIHAYYHPERRQDLNGLIHGAVVAWGWVVEHEWGFRAQHAKVIALTEPLMVPDRESIAQGSPDACWMRNYVARAADRYGIPVLGALELVEYGKWWGEVRGCGE